MSMTVCMNIFDDNEARRIAEDLAAKYDGDALAYAKARAERAVEIGDELAQAIWRKVITITNELFGHGT
jgi:hypothetical protein